MVHPVTNKVLSVHRRSLADGKARRSTSGSSTARSSFPLADAPEHSSQLPDMCVIFRGPEWTHSITEDLEKEYDEWLGEKSDNSTNRRKFAQKNLGNTGRSSATKIDMENYYSGAMHCGIRSAETIARKMTDLIDHLKLPKKKWYGCISKVTKKNPQTSDMIRFSEDGVLAFAKNATNFVKEAGVTGIHLETLKSFFDGLYTVYYWLLNTPTDLTGYEFEIHARCLLGFQFVQIFGKDSVTPSIKQLVAYTAFYIDKAITDGALCGLKLSLRNFSDSIMETAHKETKGGLLRFSGGKKGKLEEIEYQKLVLAQQMANNLLRIKTREENPFTSTSQKFKKRENSSTDEESTPTKRKKSDNDSHVSLN